MPGLAQGKVRDGFRGRVVDSQRAELLQQPSDSRARQAGPEEMYPGGNAPAAGWVNLISMAPLYTPIRASCRPAGPG
jgi:hypothetical protein